MLRSKFTILAKANLALDRSKIMIISYQFPLQTELKHTLTIVNYDRKTFVVQTAGYYNYQALNQTIIKLTDR
jgi:hypothetical protein